MSKYKATIGMEVHVELKTKSKMFCDSKNAMGEEKKPNVHICPVCTGQPGTLPVPNRQAIEFVQLAGLALNCEIAKESKFDRKNYFYPDLPKGYQISQYDQPLCRSGKLEMGSGKIIGITRIHLEEDTGKLIHPVKSLRDNGASPAGAGYTLVDFNRAGVPLMELVTEPDIESGAEARLFCQKLQQICRYLEISEADMEKGHMRCEANISLYKEGENKLSGVKVEVKNINSFKFVEKAIDYEIKRQTEILEKGEKVIQETRGYDSNKNITVSQRTKESAHDYRYFPEPDIPPLKFTEDYINNLRAKLPELPDAKKKRLIAEYNLSSENVEVIVSDKGLADYFEQVVSEIKEKRESSEVCADENKCVKLSANYIVSELQKHLIRDGVTVRDIKITPENYAELVGFIADGKISSSAAQTVLEEMYKTGGDPSQIIKAKNLAQVSDESELDKTIQQVLDKNTQSMEDYKKGKANALQFLIGQVMAKTGGRANPKMVAKILKIKLN
ncbi:MAG: Asp-tRNA(Asn)/Glu-tRNA(Gln) amidotransferase subunit GatB [Candidatus Moranbacteria bacterium]|nr:Asp-tRNA(Asn)/Glu-tRNA(Gln) amidotransferase subunit GatB [Candidatus Moranbacteria bacterium]